MLEAVNSVLQTAPLARANAEQASVVDSFAANPERVQRAAPQAPYISPYIFLDVNYDKAVIQLRNGDTGDVEDQFPSEAALQAAARQAARRQVTTEQQVAAQAAPSRGADSAQAAVQKAQSSSITPQQQAAFQAAASSGNANAGNVTLFA